MWCILLVNIFILLICRLVEVSEGFLFEFRVLDNCVHNKTTRMDTVAEVALISKQAAVCRNTIFLPCINGNLYQHL